MSDTSGASGTPTSGTEPVSRFMMGLEGDPGNEDALDEAITKAFEVDRNDVTVGNPDGVEDSDDAGNEEEEEVEEESIVPPPASGAPPDASQGQGGEVEDGNVATGETDFDFATLFEQRYGRPPQPEEYEGLLALADWANNLTPGQQAAINAALEAPAASATPTPNVGQVSVEPPAPEPDPLSDELVAQYGEDDPLVKAFQAQQAKLAQLEESYQRQYVQETQQHTIQSINLASDNYKASHGEDFTDTDLARLQGAVASAGVFPGFVQAAGGDVATAMEKALDWAYWQDEVCREREIARRASATPVVQQAHKARQTKAASVTGTGGNGASRTEPPSKNTDPWAQVAAGLREASNNGVPS